MRTVTTYLAAGLALLGGGTLPGIARADVIDFNTAVAASPFTGTYSENGYNITYVSGTLRLLVNNPTFGNLLTTNGTAPGTFDLTRTDGGQFSIGMFSAAAGQASITVTYSLAGFLSGVDTYNQVLSGTTATGGNNSFLLTPTPTLNQFDRVDFSLSSTGSSAAIDNINVTSIAAIPPPPTDVPEPASLALLAVGAAGIGLIRRRRAHSWTSHAG